MKKLYTLLLWSAGLAIVSLPCKAQLTIDADAVVASSSDFVQANVLVDGDQSNYTYLSASLGILSTSSLTVTFPQVGHAGDIISFDIQESGDLLSLLTLSTSLLNNITVKVYDDANALVATGSGTNLLSLDLSLNGPNVYTLRYMTDATANYKIKKVTLELNNLLNVNTFKEFRIYNAKLQTPCPAVYANGVLSFSNLPPLGPSVTNSANAISASTTDFATMNAPVLSNPSLDLSFSTKGIAGEYVGVTINQSGTILSLSLLQALILEVYNSSGVKVAVSPNFALADLRLVDGTTDKYYLGFITPAGSYDIAHVNITFGGLNLLTSMNVFNAMHFKLKPAPVSITSTSSSFCDGSTFSLTANAPSLSNITWNTGSTTNPLVVSSANTYYFTATDAQGCVSTSAPISVTKLTLPTLSITNGSTANFCAGKTVTLSAAPSAGATVLWSNGASTNDITVSTAGTYTVTATGTNGCLSLPSSVVVSSLPLPTLSITNGSAVNLCAGKTVTLSAVPSAGATVLWSNGATTNDITVSTAGTYTVTATGTNTCLSLPASVTVTSLPLPTISITNGGTASFCAGKTVTLSAAPSAGATVLWSNGAATNDITVSTAGTYTVTATGTNSCISLPGSVVVSSLPLPTVSITNGSTANFCAGKTVTLSSTPSAGATVLWSNGATTNDITVSTAGTYTVTATGTNTCLSLPASVTVSSLPLPTISITNGSTANFCAGKTVTLSAAPSAGATVLWSNGATTNDITVSTAGTYTVTATGTNTCLSLPASVTVTSLPLPTISITNGSTASFCAGKTVILSAVPSSGATVLWSNGAATSDISVSTAGTYTVTATGTNTCTSLPASVTVSSLPLPTISITNGSTASFCAGKTVTLSATPSSGATVLWSNGATTNDISVSTAGTYTVTATGTNTCVSLPGSVVVSSLPLPTVSITNGSTASFCAGKTVTLTATPSSGATVLWNTGATTNDISVNTAGAYTVTATGTNSCVSLPASTTVSSLPLPTVSITNGSTASFCENKTVTLSALPSSGATVLWSNGASTNDITVNTAGTYTVTATDANNCVSITGTITVSSLPLPTVSITNGNTTSFCENKNIILSAVPSAGATVLWSNGATTNDITANTAGTYTVTATGTNTCTSLPASVNVSSIQLPVVSISNGPTADFCTGKTITLNAVPSANTDVLWSNGATTNDITVSTSGTYTVTATDEHNCISLPVSIIVSSLMLPTVSVAADGPVDFCPGSHVKLIATASSGTTLLWTNGQTTSEITVANDDEYSVTATDVNGCEATSSAIEVTLKDIPEITATTANVTCNGLSDGSISIAPKSISASYEYSWNTSASTASISGLIKGQYSVTIQDMNSLCSMDFDYSISEPAILQVNIVSSHESCALNDGNLKFTITGGTAPYTYNNPSVQQNQISGLKAGVYSFVVTDAHMCTQTISEIIAAPNCATALNIHNVVTPNNDGLNDVMIIDGLENFPNTSLEIFDKWGDVVYDSKDYHNNWNGRNKNDSGPLPSGTYYYLLKLSTTAVPNGTSEYTGYVMIQ